MIKYIVVTGGVVSGIGKGITTASIGLLLKSSGFSVDAIKFDPYLNVDPGTMSPYEHGEVYVLNDGAETDLDLGHYERFLNTDLEKISSVSAGRVYDSILSEEREGKTLGKTVQLIPHVTNRIKDLFKKNTAGKQNHIRLIEIGGSTGDMEAEIFLESFRQLRSELGKQIYHIHLGYVPFLRNCGEFKSKPFQTSLKELSRSGLQPDMLVVRYAPENGVHFDKSILEKMALFSNLDIHKVIPLPDLESIYDVPTHLLQTSTVKNLSEFVGVELKPVLPNFFLAQSKASAGTQTTVKIGLVAKYSKLNDAYLSILESLKIAGVSESVVVETVLIDSQQLERNGSEANANSELEKLHSVDAILVPGGFGNRGMEGKILAVQYARENQVPFLGICLGLQMAVVEIARHKLGLAAVSREMLESEASENKEVVIDMIPEQRNINKLGGTMRLGAYSCELKPETLAYSLFGKAQITERHRHRLEVQPQYVDRLQSVGLIVSGRHNFRDVNNQERSLVEIVELDRSIHPFFIGIQSHPEFLSRPDKPHPLFQGLVQAAKARL
jgi:CTP synthase